MENSLLAEEATDEEGYEASKITQYLSFELAGETYAVDILRVVEIRGWTPVTTVPNTRSYIKGILNLRGIVLPVFDLRERFNLDPCDYGPTTVVIILKVMTRQGEKIMGVVVDAVRSVLDITPEDLREKPDCGSAINADFIESIASLGDLMVMLLDIDSMLTEHSITEPDAEEAEEHGDINE